MRVTSPAGAGIPRSDPAQPWTRLCPSVAPPPRRRHHGYRTGIVLLVIGLILVLGVVQVDISFIDDGGLGWILLIAGVLAIVLALVMNRQRSETKHVEERRYNEPPR